MGNKNNQKEDLWFSFLSLTPLEYIYTSGSFHSASSNEVQNLKWPGDYLVLYSGEHPDTLIIYASSPKNIVCSIPFKNSFYVVRVNYDSLTIIASDGKVVLTKPGNFVNRNTYIGKKSGATRATEMLAAYRRLDKNEVKSYLRFYSGPVNSFIPNEFSFNELMLKPGKYLFQSFPREDTLEITGNGKRLSSIFYSSNGDSIIVDIAGKKESARIDTTEFYLKYENIISISPASGCCEQTITHCDSISEFRILNKPVIHTARFDNGNYNLISDIGLIEADKNSFYTKNILRSEILYYVHSNKMMHSRAFIYRNNDFIASVDLSDYNNTNIFYNKNIDCIEFYIDRYTKRAYISDWA